MTWYLYGGVTPRKLRKLYEKLEVDSAHPNFDGDEEISQFVGALEYLKNLWRLAVDYASDRYLWQ